MAQSQYPFKNFGVGKSFSTGISTHVDWDPRTNTIEMGEVFVIEVELPGVDKKDVCIMVQNDFDLIIRGTKFQPKLDPAATTYHMFEREFGSFYKKITVEFPIDISQMDTTMDNGVLTIRLPKKKTNESRSITINDYE